MKRKLLSVLLTLCLAFSLLPTTALADEGPDTNLPAADENGVITLNNDVTVNTQLSISGTVTLDLNGYTVKVSGYTAKSAQVSVTGTLTLQDSSETGTGKICSDYTGTAGVVVQVEKNGRLILEGGTITTEGMAKSGNALKIAAGGTVEMTGGTIKCDAKRGNRAVNIARSGSAAAEFTMTGGSVVAEESYDGETYIIAIAGASASKIAISGNSVVSGPQAVSAPQSETAITGGTFAGTVEAKTGSITGGTFDREIPLTALEPGHISVKNEDGTYSVSAESYAAAIGETGYATLTEAVSNAASGSTITLLDNVVLKNTLFINGDKTLTLDMNGKKITDDIDEQAQTAGLLTVGGSANVTITGNGTFDYTDDYYNKAGGYKGVTGYLITVFEDGRLTIEDGTFNGAMGCIRLGKLRNTTGETAKVTIKGGTYESKDLYSNHYWTLNKMDGTTTTFELLGGTFVKFNPAKGSTENPNEDFVAEGCGISKSGDKYTVMSVSNAAVLVLDENGTVKYCFRSTSNTPRYEKALTNAIAAAEAGDTVKLLKDVTASSLKAGFTYDLNGYTLTYTSTSGLSYENKTMSFIDSSVSGTARGGTLKMTGVKASHAGITVGTGATLNVSNINVVATKGECFFPKGDAARVNVVNCDMSANYYCIGTNAATTDNYNVIIDLKGSTFTSKNATDGTPVYINVEGVLNIDDCELTSPRQGLMVRAGTANITNSTITTTGKYTNKDQYYTGAWGSGNEVPAAALVVGNYAAGAATAYEANAVVTVGNTKLTGENGFPALYVDGNTTYTSSVTLGGENTYVSGEIMKGQQTAEGKVLLTVTGGLFTSDPSAYCAEGKTGVASGNSQYPYTVGTKDANAKPAHVDTATVPAKTAGDASQDVKEVADKITGANVTNNAAEAATKDLANKNELTGGSVLEDNTTVVGKLNAATSGTTEAENVAIVYQTYVDVTVTDAKKDATGVTEITVDLTPMYRVVATTSDVVNGDQEIKVEGDIGVNAVVIQEGKKLDLGDHEYEVKLALPDSFAVAGNKLSIKHIKDNGTVEYYTGTVSEESSKLYVTFTTKGFSPFTISAPAASIDETMYPTLAEAIAKAANGSTIKLEKVCDESVSVSGKSLTIDKNNHVYNFANVTVDSNSTKTENGDTLTITYTAPSYYSGSSSDPTYSVSTPSKTEHGTVTVSPKSASKGDTVTVTVKPDSGYVLETLTVTDKNGNELTLKDKGDGKYTFTMPAGKVEVKATFMEDNSMLNFFYDVPNNAYFYEAVKWAVENGITTGVGNDLFAPEQPCTRAQIVTFLWRAAGSPEPKGAASGMTDVVSGSYYEKAVAWAIENGITTGTTTSTFSPDATCTRAQAVTFLARALNAKAASAAEFSDVPTGSYFADAVAWAAANGVTEGIGGGLFGSDNDCTRGQIVTFLYRAYNK